jgi:hypothetical protein
MSDITHLLRVDSFDRDCVGQIFEIIANKLIVKEVQGISLAIRWIPRGGIHKLNAFSTTLPFFTDLAVHLHTKELEKDLQSQLKGKIFNLTITKPLTRSVTLA